MSVYQCILVGTSDGIGPSIPEIVRAFDVFSVEWISRFFLTKADGPNQPNIWNFAIVVKHDGAVTKQALKGLEKSLGRLDRFPKDLPREVDIDPLFTFEVVARNIWKCHEVFDSKWHQQFYSRLPVLDLCQTVLGFEADQFPESDPMLIDHRIGSVWPAHLINNLNSDFTFHHKTCLELLDYIESNKNGDLPILIGSFAVMNGGIVARSMSEGCTIRHSEILVMDKLINQFGKKALKNIWIYSNMQPCSSCFATMLESNIAGCVWMIDYSGKYTHLYEAPYKILEMQRSDKMNPVMTRGILSDLAEKQLDQYISSKNNPATNAELAPVEIATTSFYDNVYYEYDDPILHPLSWHATKIHEDILAKLRKKHTGPILDIGCGLQKPLEEVVGLDFSASLIEIRKSLYPNSQAEHADILSYESEKEYFAFLAGLIIDHIANLGQFFDKLTRLASPNAELAITFFAPHSLPGDKYLGSYFKYYSHNGTTYNVKHINWSLQDIIDASEGTGWEVSSDPQSHILPYSEFDLVEVHFSLTTSNKLT